MGSCYVVLLQAQEQLLEVPWPAKLLEHPYCAPVHLGAACTAKNPAYAAAAAAGSLDAASTGGGALKDQGPLLMAGLRVRMGINTGWLAALDGFVLACAEALYDQLFCADGGCESQDVLWRHYASKSAARGVPLLCRRP
jgi:hypothetical protein